MRKIVLFFILAICIIPASTCFSKSVSSGNAAILAELEQTKKKLIETESKLSALSSQVEDISLLMQKISDLSRDLELSQSKIKSFQDEIISKNDEINLLKTESKKNNEYNTQALQDEINAKSSELQDLRGKLTDLINRTNTCTLPENNIKSNIQPVNFTKTDGVSNKQIPAADLKQAKLTDTIVFQTKQISKAYEEINKLQSNEISLNKVLSNFLLLAQNLHKQGKTQDAVMIYEILSRAEFRNPQVYKELAAIYQHTGLNLEANKQYSKLYNLFPDLKGNEKTTN